MEHTGSRSLFLPKVNFPQLTDWFSCIFQTSLDQAVNVVADRMTPIILGVSVWEEGGCSETAAIHFHDHRPRFFFFFLLSSPNITPWSLQHPKLLAWSKTIKRELYSLESESSFMTRCEAGGKIYHECQNVKVVLCKMCFDIKSELNVQAELATTVLRQLPFLLQY